MWLRGIAEKEDASRWGVWLSKEGALSWRDGECQSLFP